MSGLKRLAGRAVVCGMVDDSAMRGTVVSVGRGFVTLSEVEFLSMAGAVDPMDGVVVVPVSRLSFVQVV